MNREHRLKRLRFRAWHRGTQEADLLIGGFFERHHKLWGDDEIDWFERFIEEQDVDIMAWAISIATPPLRWDGAMMRALQSLDYVRVAK